MSENIGTVIFVMVFLGFCVFVILMAKGFSDHCNHNRKLDADMKSRSLKLKSYFERRESIEREKNKRKKTLADLGLCKICKHPETKEKLQFGICRKCAEEGEV